MLLLTFQLLYERSSQAASSSKEFTIVPPYSSWSRLKRTGRIPISSAARRFFTLLSTKTQNSGGLPVSARAIPKIFLSGLRHFTSPLTIFFLKNRFRPKCSVIYALHSETSLESRTKSKTGRPNDIVFDPESLLKAKVNSRVFLGSEYNYFLSIGEKQIRVQQSMLDARTRGTADEGETVGIRFLNTRCYPAKKGGATA